MIIGKRVLEDRPTIPAGYHLPLGEKALTLTTVIVKQEGVPLIRQSYSQIENNLLPIILN